MPFAKLKIYLFFQPYLRISLIGLCIVYYETRYLSQKSTIKRNLSVWRWWVGIYGQKSLEVDVRIGQSSLAKALYHT